MPWDEPVWHMGEDLPFLTCRRLLSWHRWQDTVPAWGAGQGLDVPQLRDLGLYPVSRRGSGIRSG